MAEIITPFAPRSGAAAAAHFVARFAKFAGVRRGAPHDGDAAGV